MIKKYSLVLMAFVCFVLNGFGQASETFQNMPSNNSSYQNRNWTGDDGGIWSATSARTDRSLTLRAICTNNTGSVTSPTYTGGMGILSFNYVRDFTGNGARSIEVWVNGIQIGSTIAVSPTSNTVANYSNTINVSGNVSLELRTSGTQIKIDDISWTSYVPCTDAPDDFNVQWPTASPQTITVGDPFDVYVRANEPGVTDVDTTNPGAGLQAWVGYSTTNDDPENNGAWTWIPATYNQDYPPYDEFMVNLGLVLAPGTYYYASRFQLNGCEYVYGGVGGVWNNNSVQLIVEPQQVDFCNLQFPGIGTITLGDAFDVYGQVYEAGLTPGAGQGAGITAEIGYSTSDTNPNTWANWIPATYNAACSDCNGGQNDEYSANLGLAIPTSGTYYYATRYSLNSGPYQYGGILNDGSAGGFWDGTTYISGVLTVNNPPLADVVITEIMYNTISPPTVDDEWIEICNISGTTQNLSGYKVNVNSNDLFTFPIGSIIADGDCITVSLGSNGDGIFNNNCPFTPDYGISANTNDSDNLINNPPVAGVNISLLSSTNEVADIVNYDDADGADGNGASLHVTDIGLDNSDTGTNWQEVVNGGSAGVNLLVSSCSPIAPEIDVERNTSASIPNGSTASTGHNTVWATTNVGDSANKTFFVRNEGFADLTITAMTTSNTADFGLINLPTFPLVLAPGGFLEFEIEFAPSSTTPNSKTSIITILNDDANENPYTFHVEGTAGCPLYTGTLSPASGPIGTEITITSNENQDLTGATAMLDGITLTTISSSTDVLVVKIPNTVTTGGALSVMLNNGCDFTNGFILIDDTVSGCEGTGGSNASDIFISQVTDSGNDSFTYIELYNGTGSTINLNDYELVLYNNGRSTPVNSNYYIDLNNVNLPDGATYVVAVGLNNMHCEVEHNPSALADQVYNVSGVSLNFGKDGDNTEGHDHLRLYNDTTHIDSWGVYEDEGWATSLNLEGKGANFMRKNDVTVPSPAFTVTDWVVQDWGNTCADLDYSDIGVFDFLSGILPTVDPLNPPVVDCELSTSISVTGTEGYNDPGDTQELAYQWFFSAPGDPGWTAVPDNDIYDDVDTDTLQILNVVGLDGYQYYCQVRENDATCFVASNAIKLTVPAAIWDGTAWTPGAPDIDTIAIIDGDYNTGTDGSFSACSLWVQSGTLTIDDNSYVEVQNNVTVASEITVEEHGSFVQRNDIGTVTVTGTVLVSKRTAPMNNWYEYTYWGSPVENETIGDALSEAHPNRRFRFVAQNYLDATAETNNDDAEVPGQDDVDDDGNDWVLVNGSHVMLPGVGYASTHSPSLYEAAPGPGPKQFLYTFEGPFNNGVYTIPIYRNDSVTADKNYNLLGNPYPSAISADAFLAENTVLNNTIDGAIYLWSQNTQPSGTANGNEVLNFSDDDYAIINSTAQTAGGDGTDPPSRYVPSGQGFFVTMSNAAPATPIGSDVHQASVTFNNAMRVTSNNDRFFRTSINALPNKLWVNLTSDNGVFNQIAIGYVDGATTAYDGMYYDAPRTLSATTRSILYSIIPDSDLKFAIQGKDPSSLTLDETIPLGFYTAIDVPTLYTFSIAQMEGNFLAENPVYVRDYLLNVTHNLSASDYTFTSETGAFNDRFEIVFRETALSVGDHEIPASGLSIIELQNGTVKFTVGHGLNIQTVEIMDLLGRRLYVLKGNSPTEIFDLSNLSQAAYIAKVTLSNGQVLTKRAIKRR